TDVGAFEWADSGPLEVRRQPDADRPDGAAAAVALDTPPFIVHERQRAVEPGDVVGRVVRDGDAVAIAVAGRVRHRLLANQIATPQVGGIDAELARRTIEQTVENGS